jgi:hypothetical protein
MSINGVSSIDTTNSQAAQSSQISPARKLRQDFDALAQALSSSNLSGAQQAFATFQQDLKSIPQNQGAQKTASSQPSSQVGQSNPQDALTALTQALNSGNIGGAQNAFSTLLQDLQGQAGAAPRHGHHHHGGGTQSTAGASATSTPTTTAPATTSVNTTA